MSLRDYSYWHMKLIVGLGNPGRGYSNNRHNMGFVCLRRFARRQGIRLDRKQCRSRIGSGEVDGGGIVLARPQTFMNLSGPPVGCLLKKYRLSLENLIVIHDDLDLPLGKIRLRQGGSSGGHNGVDSIISALGSRDFIRIRVGIGRPEPAADAAEPSDADIIGYVLGDFTSEEKQVVGPVVAGVSEAITCLLSEGLTAAMNKHNRPFAKP